MNSYPRKRGRILEKRVRNQKEIIQTLLTDERKIKMDNKKPNKFGS